ncbi:MAG: hypothetical protein M3R38_03230 [Actinomycetota bacterium]|nr:hypothetical protein [Actinomycetota bacterium]
MLSDGFEADLRTALQVQADLLYRIERTVEGVERDFAEGRAVPDGISEAEAILAELEEGAGYLEAEDLADFDPEEVPRIYERRRAAVSSELVRIGYRGWDDFVRQTRTFAVGHGLDPLAPFDVLLNEEDAKRLRRESYGAELRWDALDYFFVYGSGMLAALTDFLLVRIPKTMGPGRYEGQVGSPLTEWLKRYDTRPGQSEGWFAEWARELEKGCKTPYDRQHAVLDDELVRIPGMGGRTHRFQSLGHDPVLGFVFGVLDILRGTVTGFSYDRLEGTHDFSSGQVFSPLPPAGMKERMVRLIEAILKHIGHLISDVATPMGLPAPLMTLLQGINVGSFGEKNRTAGEVARWMYLEGYDLRHFVVGGVTPAVIEIILRAYLMLRHYSEHGETKFRLAASPKYRSMLLTAHGVAAVANAGKVTLCQGNPLAINQAEWMAFLRYLFPHMKYWLFDRHRLKLEHMDRINEAGWDELALNSGRVLERVAADQWEVVRLGRREG